MPSPLGLRHTFGQLNDGIGGKASESSSGVGALSAKLRSEPLGQIARAMQGRLELPAGLRSVLGPSHNDAKTCLIIEEGDS
jgi:hypothetical protein